jgi:DNA-binding NtrC family response regulator
LEVVFQEDKEGAMSGMTKKTHVVYRELSKAIQSPFNLLLEGESGVGKMYFAQLIHQERNWGGEFVVFDFERTVQEQTGMVEQLISRVFLGKSRGCEARHTYFMRRVDLLEEHLLARFCDFLDDLGDGGRCPRIKLLSLGLIGSLETSGHRKTPNNIQLHQFLDSLFCMRLKILPLRERREEIPKLVDTFVSHFNREYKRKVFGVNPEALEILLRYDWPNNVCELRMEIERAVTLTGDREPMKPKALSEHLFKPECKLHSLR